MTKRIPLTGGGFALVDDADFEVLSAWKWRNKNGRADRMATNEHGKRVACLMHRFIMDAPRGAEVDHIDRNSLNNTKGNLRLCTSSQNKANTAKRVGGTSTLKGVCLHKKTGKWQAAIKQNRKNHHLGLFDSEQEAHAAYVAASEKLFGEFARAS